MIPKGKGAVGSEERCCGRDDSGAKVDRLDFLWLDGHGCEASFCTGYAEHRGYCEVPGEGVVAKLELAGPAGFRGPVGDSLFLVHCRGLGRYRVLHGLGRGPGEFGRTR